MEQPAKEGEPTTQPVKEVTLADFIDFLCKLDESVLILQRLDQMASSFELTKLERYALDEPLRRGEHHNLFYRMFEVWMVKVEALKGTPTLGGVATVLNRRDINSVEVHLKKKFKSLDLVIVVPKSSPMLIASEEVVKDKPKEVDVAVGAKEAGAGKKKFKGIGLGIFSLKKKAPGAKDAAEVAAADSTSHGTDYDEIKHLSEEDAKQLTDDLVAPFYKLSTSLQIIQFLCRSVYHVAACVPKEDGWIGKVALVAMEMFSIVRYFIKPGKAIRRSQFEGVVRRYVVDPGLAPQLIGALVASELLIPKEDEEKSLLLIEPAVKDAIDELQKSKDVLKHLGGSYVSVTKVQEKLLVAVVAAVEEHKLVVDQKAFGKKLSAHISYLVKKIVWRRNYPGFANLQAKIPKVIRFCNESVIAVAMQRFESLPSVTDEELAIFRKAYTKAQEEKMHLSGMAGAALGFGLGAALAGINSD